MSEPVEWDFPATKRHYRRKPEIIEATNHEVRRRRPIGFGWSIFIVAIAALVLLRFAWAPLLMGAVLLGIETPRDMAAMVIAIVVLAAIALRGRLAERRF
jgi:hypothetical protein